MPLASTTEGSSQSSNGNHSFNLDDSPMPEEWKERIRERLNSIPEVFALDELSFGHTATVKHHIRLQDDTPFKERSRPIHPSDREAVRQHLRELLDADIIRESESPLASPVVVVKKKNGKIRLCIDYRKLNSRTIKDAYALPNIEETFSALSGARWFSVMDLKSGYYQVEMAEEDKAKTAFTVPLGFYEFNRMPQGVTNAPSTFQRLMEKCVGDVHLSKVLVFLDDVIVFSQTLEEHEARLMKVLNCLKSYGLKLSPEKCQFFKSSMKYLGHVVDAQGVHTDPDKVSALKDWPCPANREELKRFLGFAGYYRRFVEGYSKIARPLNTLTAGYYPPRKRGKTYKAPRPNPGISPRTPFGAEWTPDCESSFRILIEKLTSAPVLAFANPKLPYVLHTDACCEGLGAALYQEQDGKLRVIAYASRGLSKSEKNYPTHKLEFLALKWAVCEKFCDYLCGTDFTVLTDNNPLTYVLSSAKLDAAGHRWLAALSTFQFNIKYRAGNTNGDADGLSRRPQAAPQEDHDYLEEKERIMAMTKRLLEGEIPKDAVSAVCQWHSVTTYLPVLAESLLLDAFSLPELFTGNGQSTLPEMTKENWYNAQRNDPSIQRVIGLVEQGQKPHFKAVVAEPPEVKLLLREWDRLELIDGVIYRKGFDRELVCMDYLSLEPDNRDIQNILVITDHFTRFAVAVPTKDQKARTIAKALWENFLIYYGFPSRLHSDQGRDFESHTIKELCSLIGADKVRTTPYHPQGNPVERFNRTLISMLGTLEEKDKHHWRDFVKPVVHAYNCTRNDSTGYSPYELMFGRQPTLPVDLILGLKPPTETHTTHSDYVQSLRQRLKESYALAAENSRKSGERNKLRFDAKVKTAELAEGDRVLVRNVNIRGKHKLADKWERTIHVVVRRIDGGPVYVVKPETGRGPQRTLHRDLLLPCGFLPVEITPDPKSHQSKQHKMHLRSQHETQDTDCGNSDEEYGEYEEYDSYVSKPLQPLTWGPYVQEFENSVVTDTTTVQGSDNAQSTYLEISQSTSETNAGEEPSELRRSLRERHPPSKFTYEELGKPLILALINGTVKKVVKIPSDPEQPQGRVLVEYSSDRAISRLDPAQLGNLPSPNNSAVTWCVRTIRELCQEELGREMAQKCLAELSSLTGISRAGFWDVLQNELQSAQHDLAPPQSPDTQLETFEQPVFASTTDSDVESGKQPSNATTNVPDPGTRSIPHTAAPSIPVLDEGTINPPHIQKVIVEHFIHSDSTPSSYSQSRIRTFSRRLPKPNGEVDYDAWRTQVDLLLSDMSLSDSQKVRRILESLLSPAADIVKPLGTNATPQAYLTQLESAFGEVEDGEELFATFLGSNQNSGEKSSVYLNRLQTLITKAISRGGVSAAESDRYLLRQFCRGCWDQSIIIGLQLEHRKSNPPTFPELLLLLRAEEDRRAAKMDRMKKHLGSSRATAHVHSVMSMPVIENEPIPATERKHETNLKLEKEVAELRKQVAKLLEQGKKGQRHEEVQSHPAHNEQPVQSESLLAQASNRDSNSRTPTPPKPWFCFKCGGDGHIAANCTFEPNPSLVQAPATGRSGAGGREQKSPIAMIPNERSSESNDDPNCRLPHGLVGPRCTSTISNGDINCESILDTGSQVTTISEAFHSKYLSNLPIHSIHNLLEVEGAGGQAVPYLGYVEAHLTFPEDVTGTEEQRPVLALIVPEYEFNSKVPVLIGTNVLLKLYQRGVSHDKSKFLKRSDSFAALLQHVARVHKTETKACPVKLHGERSITNPARQKICLLGDVRVGKANLNTNFVVEPPESSFLPGDLFVQSALININTRASNKIPVVLSNTTDHNVTLPLKCVIGEVSVVQRIMPLASTTEGSSQSSNGNHSFNLDDSPMPEEWKERIRERLNSIPEVFALDELSFGHTATVKHHIRLQDDTPFKERSRPIHPSDREAVRQHLRELLDADIIRESESPLASPVVVVKKKNGKIRLCIDYRKLNSRTIKDAYALPNIEETFSALSGARWFSVMDLKSGYYQVEMAEEDKAKTAFTCSLGFYEFNRMPQGVTNAPSTFQRLMEKCVGDVHLSKVLVFLDDVIVFSQTLEEHEARLMKVLNCLKSYGLKLSPEKCQFFKSSMKYLGHVVDAQGVHTDPDKVSALKDWPCPANREELKRFLGFAGYYRRFVEGYSKIARPLNTLTAGYYPPRKRGKTYKAPRLNPGISPRTPFGAEWTPECESSFRILIEKLTSAPVLAFANPKLPYVLHTDGCCEGLGAALYQEQDGKLRVIAYASRGLSKSEKNYPTHKLEFLALKWAVCEKFCDYLCGTDFTVLTDNNPLTYVLSSAKLDAAGHRWLAALSTFQFNIKYRAGNTNGDADGLSRRPQAAPQEDHDYLEEKERIMAMTKRLLEGEIPKDAVSAVCQWHSVTTYLPVLAESLLLDAFSLPELFTGNGQSTLPGMTKENWYNAQRNDPSIQRVIGLVEQGQKPHFKAVVAEPPEVKLLLREWDRLELIDGVLFRKDFDRGDKIHQLILPEMARARFQSCPCQMLLAKDERVS
ncbi:LOW QUALITY PROTEIN: uncharacterized protein LOC129411251 [Boleophthalmus pectinirostris]|uniref:LOW QUALITY PROTEIN: uncharacterized protein LOC129411251 n=1 Tax=Boleophthalmus pectinirostris TaxID=150288 RepID=UPI00242DB53B|nr:LOW QUALITY PROTEIN: uncharacterized protein LOC129411251 [Boleophthalmus pectinirostris]